MRRLLARLPLVRQLARLVHRANQATDRAHRTAEASRDLIDGYRAAGRAMDSKRGG